MDAISMIAATVAIAMMAITVSLFSPDSPTGVANPAGTEAQHASTARH